MTKEYQKKLQAFFSQKVAKGEFTEEQLDKLSDVLFPNDGSNQGMLSSVRQQESEFAAWLATPAPKKDEKHEVKPMSDEEIEELAALI